MQMLMRQIAVGAALLAAIAAPAEAGDPKDRTVAPKADKIRIKAPDSGRKLDDALFWSAPQGDEVFCHSASYPLIWKGGGDGAVFFYLIDSAQWRVVDGGPQGNFDNSGKLSWKVPSHIPPGDYQLYIQRVDGVDWKYSGIFKISACGCD